MAHLKSLSPSAIDFEFQTLSLEKDCIQLIMVMQMLEDQLETNRDYELVQAYLNVFLKVNNNNKAVYRSMYIIVCVE